MRETKPTLPFSPVRRGLIFGAGAATALLAMPAIARPLTPRSTEGPFYPRTLPLDRDADLTRVDGRSARAEGTILDIAGRVVDPTDRPVDGAVVEIWQCDAYGSYHHVGSAGRVGSRIDRNFQGYGRAKTAADGGFRFRTIRPVPYPGRTPHIHVIVSGAGLGKLTSQLYIKGYPQNARDYLYRSLGGQAVRDSVSMAMAKSPDKAADLSTQVLLVVGRNGG